MWAAERVARRRRREVEWVMVLGRMVKVGNVMF
jgi:hypothetical protein